MTRRSAQWTALVAAAAIVLVVAVVAFPFAKSVGLRVLDSLRAPTGDPIPVETADLSGTGPGSLVSAMTMPRFMQNVHARHMKAARVEYRSTSSDGQETIVSGSVFVPRGDPPVGGWPVVALGHGTTGLDEPCAPSLSDSLLGYAEAVGILARKGYAVALADYQGIGAPGVHPYTDSRTAGLNMIDSVRALRATFSDVSNRWGAFGGSQGGGATWAADEQARTYAPELNLVGAVAVSPVTDITRLVDKAQYGTLTKEQTFGMVGITESLARLHPDINRDDYRSGAAARYWDSLAACSGPEMDDRAEAADAVRATDVVPSTPAAADRLRHYLAQWALPQQRLSAPLYVWYGGEDTFFDTSWTVDAIERACAMGGAVVAVFEEDKGHGEINYTDQFQWLDDRFAGKPVMDACA
ncbi:MAG TPA: lipase family protein [Mycobacterium sp.]|nr:lipase family protein [Mycobacterium sp.]